MTIFSSPPLIEPRLRAVQALLVYKDNAPTYDGPTYAFTTHEITPSAGGDRIGPGRVLGLQDQQALLDALLGSLARETDFLPPEVLCHSSTQIAWYVPGRVRRMWFRLDKKNLCLNVPWPHLLFCAKQRGLFLAALTHGTRPSPNTPLYHAPLMNVFESTALCTGSAELPRGWSVSQRAGYEAAVFDTNFTHTNHRRTLALRGEKEITSERHLRFWRDLHTRASKRFPTRALVPLKQSVAHWLNCR